MMATNNSYRKQQIEKLEQEVLELRRTNYEMYVDISHQKRLMWVLVNSLKNKEFVFKVGEKIPGLWWLHAEKIDDDMKLVAKVYRDPTKEELDEISAKLIGTSLNLAEAIEETPLKNHPIPVLMEILMESHCMFIDGQWVNHKVGQEMMRQSQGGKNFNN